MTQWRTEIEKFTDNSLTVCVYHGPDRESQTPRELLKKYDVVLTTYQVVEADFRKMVSPNRVECPNCGGKFKFDKLHIHLKYFCGAAAQKTDAQARQRRSTDRVGQRGRRAQGTYRQSSKRERNGSAEKRTIKPKQKQNAQGTKEVVPAKGNTKFSVPDKDINCDIKRAPPKRNPKKMISKSTEKADQRSSVRPSRPAARRAISQMKKSVAEWMQPEEDDLDSDTFRPESSGAEASSNESNGSSDTDSNSSVLQKARIKQQQALDSARKSKGKKSRRSNGGTKSCASPKKTGKKTFAKKGNVSNDDFCDSSGNDESDDESKPEIDVDMEALVIKAMQGGKTDFVHLGVIFTKINCK